VHIKFDELEKHIKDGVDELPNTQVMVGFRQVYQIIYQVLKCK